MTMTIQQVKEARELIEELELLEAMATQIGRHDLDSISINFHHREPMVLPGPVVKLIRCAIEQAFANQITSARLKLAEQYSVRTAA